MKFLAIILSFSLISCSTMGGYEAQRERERQKRLYALAKMGLYSTKDREYFNYCFLLWDMIHVPGEKLKKAKYPNPKNPFESVDIKEMIGHYSILQNNVDVNSPNFFSEIKRIENQVVIRKIFKDRKCGDHNR